MIPTPGQSAIQADVVSFLGTILPGVEVIEGYDNQVPEPTAGDFIVLSVVMRTRLATNYVANSDVAFTGQIAGTALTVSSVMFGTINVASQPPLWGVGVTTGMQILSQQSGTPGGVGVYTVSASQTIGPITMAAGQLILMQPTKVGIQMDVHSNTMGDGGDMAEVISTAFRSDRAAAAFAGYANGVFPLTTEDPKFIAYENQESQWESRWVCEASLQANQQIPWPQQFMTQAIVQFDRVGV